MKSFALDASGDLLIVGGKIQMVDGKELTRQKVEEVISTNKGEWPFDWEQGITFSNILGKGVTKEAVMFEIESGLRQVDDGLIMSDFSTSTEGRTLNVNFTATDGATEVEVSAKY